MNLFTKVIYNLKRIIYLLFKENFHKKLKFDWSLYPKRYDIINNLIKFKNFKDYLEIGCFKNENFEEISIFWHQLAFCRGQDLRKYHL